MGIHLWKKTMNYRGSRQHVSSEAVDRESFITLPPMHPCSGQYSLGDMRLHLSNTITNTEGGKKVTQALGNTGRAVAGSISNAKGVFSSWMSSLKSNESKETTANKEDVIEDKSVDQVAQDAIVES